MDELILTALVIVIAAILLSQALKGVLRIVLIALITLLLLARVVDINTFSLRPFQNRVTSDNPTATDPNGPLTGGGSGVAGGQPDPTDFLFESEDTDPFAGMEAEIGSTQIFTDDEPSPTQAPGLEQSAPVGQSVEEEPTPAPARRTPINGLW